MTTIDRNGIYFLKIPFKVKKKSRSWYETILLIEDPSQSHDAISESNKSIRFDRNLSPHPSHAEYTWRVVDRLACIDSTPALVEYDKHFFPSKHLTRHYSIYTHQSIAHTLFLCSKRIHWESTCSAVLPLRCFYFPVLKKLKSYTCEAKFSFSKTVFQAGRLCNIFSLTEAETLKETEKTKFLLWKLRTTRVI